MLLWLFIFVREERSLVVTDVADGRVFADVAAHLQDLVLGNRGVEQLLQDLAEYSAARLGSAGRDVSCGIRLTRPKKPTATAGSSPGSCLLTELEDTQGDGPGLAAIRTRGTVLVPDLEHEDRWPEYVVAAREQGIGSVLGIPLILEGKDLGALTLHFEQPGACSGDDAATAEAYTEQVSKGLTLALRMARLQESRDGMSAAMQSRTVIDLATGAIMAQNRCSQAAAFQVLREASNSRNVKLRDVAATVVSSVAGGTDTFTYFDE
ncbi:GAF and ANTAR domain-containing protein [Arthrobacter sp. P2b]|jgi:GAF domain-containing protein|uniref:GAF and ANTAR domain-containing protein n=1 Tax=Arthrobacter sp. P2b TaxID=1938741 RepID=UPI0009A8B37D|nr:GAF and ANTAR domain-containing protein [Arthrobacter sp. P2b]SLK02286.1 GAF domain-containing protein [Arthrobacter sp. P2b]